MVSCDIQSTKIYLIGGLGADSRVFQYLQLDHPSIIVDWLPPLPTENLEMYAKRLSQKIDTSSPFILLGVSFGGVVAIELSKIVRPNKLILISSFKSKDEMPSILKISARLGLFNHLPAFLLKPPTCIYSYFFSAKNKKLLSDIIRDTDSYFIRWALTQMGKWAEKKQSDISIIQIHGTHDRLIPLPKNAIKIKGAGHFMIVDSAIEISSIINKCIATE